MGGLLTEKVDQAQGAVQYSVVQFQGTRLGADFAMLKSNTGCSRSSIDTCSSTQYAPKVVPSRHSMGHAVLCWQPARKVDTSDQGLTDQGLTDQGLTDQGLTRWVSVVGLALYSSSDSSRTSTTLPTSSMMVMAESIGSGATAPSIPLALKIMS